MKYVAAILLLVASNLVVAASIIDIVIESTGEEQKRVTYTITIQDNEGINTTHRHGPVLADSSYNPVNEASAIAASVLEQLQEQEAAETEDQIMEVDVLNRSINPKWTTTKRIVKRLIRKMMREQDPRLVIILEPVIQYLKANYNANQIANFLDITTAQVLRMNRRINAILQDSGTVKAQLLVFEAEQEELE